MHTRRVPSSKQPPRLPALALIAFLALPATSRGATVVHPGESIQAAIDAAKPGTTILVEPGTYHEAGTKRAVSVSKDGIRLVGRPRPGRPVILEQSGTQTHGIWVSPTDTLDADDAEQPPCGPSGARLKHFALRGFTVQGFADFGVYLACVDGFDLRRNVARDDGEYSLFPVRSSHGRMSHNTGSGTRSDSCIYVGQDDHIVVDHNTATDCQIGLQIENSTHVRFTANTAENNTAGMIVDVLNGRQVTVAADNVVRGNVFRNNNRLNSADPGEDTYDLQPGIGLVVDGADRTVVTRNTITGNSLAGVTLVSFCIDRPQACGGTLDINPYPDGNRFVRNTFSGNARDMLVLTEHGSDNCIRANRPDPLNLSGEILPTCR